MRRMVIGVFLALLSGVLRGETAPSLEELTVQARTVAGDLVAMVGGELKRALEFSGPLRAIIVCKYSVPELSSNVSRRTGWRVSRVSLRPRNPTMGMADAWEQQVLVDWDRRVEAGEKAASLEIAAIVDEPAGRYFRYMKALPMGALCQACHGDAITPAIRSHLNTEYPHDRAKDFRLGQVRGAVTIKRDLTPRAP